MVLAFFILTINLIPAMDVGISDGSNNIGIDLIDEILDWTINNLHVLGDSIFEGTVTFKDNVTIITPAILVVNTSLTITDWLGNPDIVLNSTGDSWFNGGNVSIGTTSPEASLHVVGSFTDGVLITGGAGGRKVLLSGTNLDYYSTSTTSGYAMQNTMKDANGNDLSAISGAFGKGPATLYYTYYGGTYNNPSMVIRTGNVGIGTTDPSIDLEIKDSSAGSHGILINTTSATANPKVILKNPYNSWHILTAYGAAYGGDLYFYQTNEGTSMAIRNATGKVGIGTITPESKLHVYDTTAITTFTGDNDQGVAITGGGTTSTYSLLGFRTSAGGYTRNIAQIGAKFAQTGSELHFGTSNSYASGITNDAMVINNIGNVGIGTTSPTQNLHVVGNVNVTGNLYVEGCIRYNKNTTIGACV